MFTGYIIELNGPWFPLELPAGKYLEDHPTDRHWLTKQMRPHSAFPMLTMVYNFKKVINCGKAIGSTIPNCPINGWYNNNIYMVVSYCFTSMMWDDPPTPSFDPVETGTSYDHSYYNHPAIPKDTITIL